jgi:hypothetical protein
LLYFLHEFFGVVEMDVEFLDAVAYLCDLLLVL